MDESELGTGIDGDGVAHATYGEVVRQRDVRILAISRSMAKTGISVLAYGTMVYLARGGASQFQLSLANGATFLAALVFGFQGGRSSWRSIRASTRYCRCSCGTCWRRILPTRSTFSRRQDLAFWSVRCTARGSCTGLVNVASR